MRQTNYRSELSLLWSVCLFALVAGCSTVSESPQSAQDIGAPQAVETGTLDDDSRFVDGFPIQSAKVDDPLEEANRATFAVNETADEYVIGPVARGYGYVMPTPAKAALRRAFSNLGAPARLVNDLLQGEISNAGTTAARFLINSTAGFAGLFDVAEEIGLEHHETSFDQTLERYGIGPGPYLVLPLLGPTTVRGTVGFVGDMFLDPLGQVVPAPAALALGGGEAVTAREAYDEQIETLRDTSVDHYAAVRSIYGQLQSDADE